jgi:hypothetical protein
MFNKLLPSNSQGRRDTNRQEDDYISLLLAYQNEESKLKILPSATKLTLNHLALLLRQ